MSDRKNWSFFMIWPEKPDPYPGGKKKKTRRGPGTRRAGLFRGEQKESPLLRNGNLCAAWFQIRSNVAGTS